MLDLKEPTKCRLILAVMWQPNFSWANIIEKTFGTIPSQSPTYLFDYSNYYAAEMGSSLKKCFVETEGLHERDQLVHFKKRALELERRFAVNGSRMLNIDPLFLSLENIIISTTKNYSHRVYLGECIYADLAFIYREKHYQPLPWTYSDYIKHVEYFENVRERLKKALLFEN